MLRGQQKLYGGDPGGAVEDLQRALKLRESLMARGMLVVAHHFSGDMDNWIAGAMAIRDLDQINELKSPEDLLWGNLMVCGEGGEVILGTTARAVNTPRVLALGRDVSSEGHDYTGPLCRRCSGTSASTRPAGTCSRWTAAAGGCGGITPRPA